MTLTGGIAGRYATALFELADQANALDAVAADMAALSNLIGESRDLKRLVSSPLFSREDQGKAMAAVLKKAGAHDLTQKFVGLTARNRRLFALADMARAFAAMMAERRGEVDAQVMSAHKLSGQQLDTLKETLKKSLDKDVRIETEVDPDLIGGLVVKVGSRMIDTSIRTKLNNLQIRMREAG